jgi:hypothetical protein
MTAITMRGAATARIKRKEERKRKYHHHHHHQKHSKVTP